MLGNWRATPTPEIEHGVLQPYDRLVHNGTIANAEELGLQEGEIDSQILPRILDRTSVHTLAESLKKIKGSYALACANERTVLAACNYKPLHFATIGGTVYFSSMARHFTDVLGFGQAPVALQPYTAIDFLTREIVPVWKIDDKSAVVIASAGLDSTVVATKLVREGHRVCLLHFTYGCLAGRREYDAIPKIAAALGCVYQYLEVDLKAMLGLGSSTLFGDGSDVAPTIAGAEYAVDWVPARNLIFMALATGWAEANGYHAVASGVNLEECISGSTQLHVRRAVEPLSVKYQSMTISMRQLWEKFHGLSRESDYQWDDEIPTWITSYAEGRAIWSQVRDVKFNGMQKVKTLIAGGRYSLVATGSHRFLTKRGWATLSDLLPGDEIMARLPRTVLNRPPTIASSYKKVSVDGNDIYEHRYLIEQKLGRKLESWEVVHHTDEDPENNALENLKLLSRSKHSRDHQLGQRFQLNWVSVDSITDCGEIEVFDLVVEETHNYLAGDFITHNSGAFPDNEEQLVHLLDLAAPYTVQAHYGMRMLSPVGTKMKHEIVRMGLDLDAPLEHTISCYKAGERPCNACAPCFMRQEAFRRNGAVDPVA